MLGRSRRRMSPGGRRWRPRRRLTGCLLWIVGLIAALIILSLMFGGFQVGTKADGQMGTMADRAGVLVPLPVSASRSR